MKAPSKNVFAFLVAIAWFLTVGLDALGGLATTNSPPSVHLTLGRAIDEALKANPGLRAAGLQANAVESEASAASRTRWGNSTGSPTPTSISARAAMSSTRTWVCVGTISNQQSD